MSNPTRYRKTKRAQPRLLHPVVGHRATTVFLRWLGNRTALAKSCEVAAAKRGDYATATRFEHEHNALIPVLEKARAELALKNKRQPMPNDRRRQALDLMENMTWKSAVVSSELVQRQAWNCERCGSEGVIEYKTDSGCYEVFMAIQSAHAAKAPTCADHSKIRVPLNDELKNAGPRTPDVS